ncbi:MAG: radical SAM protein [Planctomycetota bacterium]|nr:radical SAM protein [Planctomycetota bacterium]
MRLRRQYLDVLRDRALDADVRTLLDTGWRWLGTALAPRSGRSLVGPALGTLLVTYRCDLRCAVCDLPARAAARRRAGDRELDTDEMKAVLRDMKAIGTAGVGVTGGEPMLRRDVLELLAYGAQLGMHMHLNTDGFQVVEHADAIRKTGVRSVNVSLDGPTAAVHDAARRKAGSFDTVLGALDALRTARGARRTPQITAVTVLTASNVGQAGEVVRVARGAGADRVGVIPVHDFGHGATAPEPEAVARGLADLKALHAEGWIDNSTAYLDLLPRAFRGEPSPLKCYAPWASVVVDCYGDVYPCFPLMEKKEPVGRIPLARFWRSKAYAEARARLASCQACLWNCHTELNLALPQRGGRKGSARVPAGGGAA